MIVTKDGLKHDQTKEVTWKETLEARPGDTLLINKPSWTCQYQGGTVISNLKVAVKGFVEHNSMRSDLKGDSETMSDWFSIGEIMDTNSRKVTIPAFVSVGGNEVKFEINASNIEGLDVDHWYIELSMTFDADYAYLNVEGGSINIGGDLSIGGSLTVPSNKGIIVDNLQGGSIKINQVTGGEIDIDSLKGGEINIDKLEGGEITVSNITRSPKSIIDLSEIYLGDEVNSDLGPSAKNLKLEPKRKDDRISYVVCDKSYLYIVCAILTIDGAESTHSGLLYIEPNRKEGKISASMIQGGWYQDDNQFHYQIIAEPCKSGGDVIADHNWSSSDYVGMRMYLHRIKCSFADKTREDVNVYTETVNANDKQNWRVWKMPVKFNISGFANIK